MESEEEASKQEFQGTIHLIQSMDRHVVRLGEGKGAFKILTS